jgi:hypothetical protein
MEAIEDKTIAEGRFISPDEVQRSAMVVVLGGEIKDKFFPNVDAIGKSLKVRGLPMRVVGVEEKRGSFFGDSIDRHIYIPVTTHLQIFGRNGLQIHGKAQNREVFQTTIEEARVDMRNKLTGRQEVRYNSISPEVYRALGFPGADDLGNMFQFKRDFEDYYCGARNLDVSRTLNPSLQTFDRWLAQNKNRIPLE